MTASTAALWVAFGGAIGAFLRFQFTAWLTSWLGKAFPYGTLFVNFLGSFVMGLTTGAIVAGLIPAEPWHDFIAEGLLGALTTFSTFSMDTYKMFHAGAPVKGVLNAVVNMALSLGGMAVGYFMIA